MGEKRGGMCFALRSLMKNRAEVHGIRRTHGIAALLMGALTASLGLACGSDDDDSSTLAADVSAVAAADAAADDTQCSCLVMVNSDDYPDKQSCLDDVEAGTSYQSCLTGALESDPAAGTAFATCLQQAYEDSENCWSPCPATLDEVIANDCHKKEVDAANACFTALPEAMASAASDCLKGI